MEFIFKGGSEFVKLKVDRIDHTLEIGSSKTNYKFVSQPFTKLFDTEQEQAETEFLDDKEFIKKLIASFNRQGYSLIKGG